MTGTASHHPHLLACATHGAVRLPVPGQAIFAQSMATDTANRLVYAPLATEAGGFSAITLPQYVLKCDNPDGPNGSMVENIRLLVENPNNLGNPVKVRNNVFGWLKGLAGKTDCPPDFRPVLNTMENKGKEGLQSLLLGKVRFIGIMVSDNLTNADRSWWALRGQLQVTTCVQGLATVRYDPAVNETLAMDYFTPLTRAVWDLQKNALVRDPGDLDSPEMKLRYVGIGTIISTGVREVNILTSVPNVLSSGA